VIDLEAQDGVFVLRMRAGENRFNPTFLEAFDAALDRVEQSGAVSALVTIGEGKFYSNGMDLDFLTGPGQSMVAATMARTHALLARLLAFPALTVAALNGHVFAGGAILALAHDLRVMRDDRGYFCLPEVDIQMPFTGPMCSLIQAKLPAPVAHEAMITGKRYDAPRALAAAMVHETASEGDVLPNALALAKRHGGKHGPTLSGIKRTVYAEVLAALEASSGRRR
jgi:enoyl-CoA hydratase/carnithine racemase